MNDTLREITDEIERGYRGDPWHGPSLLSILEGIDASVAAAVPITGAHTIAQLVLHIASWKEIVAERVRSDSPVVVNSERDWPAMASDGDDAWQATLRRLESAELKLIDAIAEFDPKRLHDTMPGERRSFAIELRGIPQHDAYHSGQIALLKRATTSRS